MKQSKHAICQNKDPKLAIGYMTMAIIFGLSLVLGLFLNKPTSAAQESLKTYTLKELSAFDGKDGRPAYFAFEGLIYDVTSGPNWKEGNHFGYMAGQDLTGALEGAPHGTEVFGDYEVVGKLAGVQADDTASPAPRRGLKPIYILGKSLTAWSGYLLGLVLIFNFMTCYAMPWSKVKLPWQGKIPGSDDMDQTVLAWVHYHKIWAWMTVVIGILHGVLGIFQSFGTRI